MQIRGPAAQHPGVRSIAFSGVLVGLSAAAQHESGVARTFPGAARAVANAAEALATTAARV